MIINGKEYVIDYVLTADDEEPNCGRCDHICDDQDFCDKCCGSEHWWKGYRNTVMKEVEEKENK